MSAELLSTIFDRLIRLSNQLVRFSDHRFTLWGLFLCFGFVFEVLAPFFLYQMSKKFYIPVLLIPNV